MCRKQQPKQVFFVFFFLLKSKTVFENNYQTRPKFQHKGMYEEKMLKNQKKKRKEKSITSVEGRGSVMGVFFRKTWRGPS